MGLDMYLSAKNYITRWDYSDGYDQRKERPEFVEAKASLGEKAKYLSPDAVGMEQTFTVMYWRKANAIHSWFVNEVQDGEDNCQESYVSIEQLAELYKACDAVIRHKFNPAIVEEFLAPADGFFFGSTEIDEWYKNDILFTHKRLGEIIDMVSKDAAKDKYVTFTYQASW